MDSGNKLEDTEIKLILVGEAGTGKTSLINVSVGMKFNKDIMTTGSSSYVQKAITVNNKKYTVNLWDTIGQEKYRSLTKIFIKDSKIVIFVYDITRKESFDELNFWFNTIEEILGKEPIIGICGNKSDLYLKEAVKEDDAREFAESKGAFFKLTSAKNDPVGFNGFLEELLKEFIKKNGGSVDNEVKGITLDGGGEGGVKKNGKCCGGGKAKDKEKGEDKNKEKNNDENEGNNEDK